MVCGRFGLEVTHLLGRDRGRRIDQARAVTYRILHDDALMSWEAAGALLGRSASTAHVAAQNADTGDLEAIRAILANPPRRGRARAQVR